MGYTSSILTKYGDLPNVKADSQRLQDIINRQGTSLLIDVLAEHAGSCANKFKADEADRSKLMQSLVLELKEALKERL